MIRELAIPTLHTRVESWECDYNDHWNARFYGRGFQAASEYVAERCGDARVAYPRVRHIRYHRELRHSATVEVLSARLTGHREMEGATVHCLCSNGEVSATAIDLHGALVDLPAIQAADCAYALPRGITTSSGSEHKPTASPVCELVLGPVRPAELDHKGELLYETLLSYASIASNHQLEQLGFDAQYSQANSISRMAVEVRATRGNAPEVGSCLLGVSRFVGATAKSVNAEHRVLTMDGTLVATLEFCLLTVSTTTRKAVALPDILAGVVDG